MRRLLVLVVVLVWLAVPASAGRFSPNFGLPTADPVEGDCNAVVSMSQGRQVYAGVALGTPDPSPLEAATGEQWMLSYREGKVLSWFTVASNWDTLTDRHRCGTDAEVDRVVFIFDPAGSGTFGPPAPDDGTPMFNHLDQVAAIVQARYPNAEFHPTMLVGADGHAICILAGQQVRASKTHSIRQPQLAAHTFTFGTVGADLEVPCSSYADRLGHLTNVGAADANAQLGVFYSGG